MRGEETNEMIAFTRFKYFDIALFSIFNHYYIKKFKTIKIIENGRKIINNLYESSRK